MSETTVSRRPPSLLSFASHRPCSTTATARSATPTGSVACRRRCSSVPMAALRDDTLVKPTLVSSAPMSARSAPNRRAPLATVARATPGDRWLAFTFLGLGIPWLVYTRLYFLLQPRHLTFDGGLFMRFFNKPDPFCGGTRTFAWMWQGDVGRAVAVYPLGPLIFVATVALVVYGLFVLVTGRAVYLNLSPMMVRGVIIVGFVALALNWIAKLVW